MSRPPGEELNIQEAAATAGVSVDTIRRRIRAGAFPNARLLDGAWRIAIADLRAADLLVDEPTPGSVAIGHLDDLRAEIERLHALLALAIESGACRAGRASGVPEADACGVCSARRMAAPVPVDLPTGGSTGTPGDQL